MSMHMLAHAHAHTTTHVTMHVVIHVTTHVVMHVATCIARHVNAGACWHLYISQGLLELGHVFLHEEVLCCVNVVP